MNFESPPQYQAPVDPNLAAQTEAANQAKADALQLRLKADTADVMTRYGARTALSGGSSIVSGGGPVAAGPTGFSSRGGGAIATIMPQLVTS